MSDLDARNRAMDKRTNALRKRLVNGRQPRLGLYVLCAVLFLLFIAFGVVGAKLIQRNDQVTSSNDRIKQLNQQLIGVLHSHGIPVPSQAAQPGGTGGTGGLGGTGGVGGSGANGGPGGKGGVGGPGGRGGTGGNGAAVVVQLTPAPGPSGSPGAQGPPGESSPGPAGSPGAQGPPGPDQCTWEDDPLHPGQQVCVRPSPTPSP